MLRYAIYYFKPEPHHYAYHTTHCWLWAKFLLWTLKRVGYNEAFIDKNSSDLKEAYIEEYGWKFGEKYDSINSGIPIGGFDETVDFLDKVEEIKKKL